MRLLQVLWPEVWQSCGSRRGPRDLSRNRCLFGMHRLVKCMNLLHSQTFLIRGLQGSYTSFAAKRNIHIPNGAVLVFALACAHMFLGLSEC